MQHHLIYSVFTKIEKYNILARRINQPYQSTAQSNPMTDRTIPSNLAERFSNTLNYFHDPSGPLNINNLTEKLRHSLTTVADFEKALKSNLDRAKLHRYVDIMIDAKQEAYTYLKQLTALADASDMSLCTECYDFTEKEYCSMCERKISSMCGQCPASKCANSMTGCSECMCR
jgi:hypothetical protein